MFGGIYGQSCRGGIVAFVGFADPIGGIQYHPQIVTADSQSSGSNIERAGITAAGSNGADALFDECRMRDINKSGAVGINADKDEDEDDDFDFDFE